MIMNEDRHAGNWGIAAGKVAPLFDHNVCFGGESTPKDPHQFMHKLTSAFEAEEQYQNRHDQILEILCQ